jgi:hypothetical protein
MNNMLQIHKRNNYYKFEFAVIHWIDLVVISLMMTLTPDYLAHFGRHKF